MSSLDTIAERRIFNEATDRVDRLRHVQQDLQRRNYNQYAPYPPPSFWQLHKSKIVIGSVIGLCGTVCAGCWWAQQRWENYQDYAPLQFVKENLLCSLENIKAGRYWVILSSSITHFNFIHLGLNMLTLYGFGSSVIAWFGFPAFFGIWITSGLCCSAASLWWEKRREDARVVGRRWDGVGRRLDGSKERNWFVPKNDDAGVMYGGSIGASGAISGIVGAVACFFPRLQVSIFPLPVLMPLWVTTAIFVGGSLYCLDQGFLPQIGHAGHLGGTAGGVVSYFGVIRPWLKRMRRL